MASFMSAVLDKVEHPVNILKEYLRAFSKVHKCKAAILSWLDAWTRKKEGDGEALWIWVVTEDLAQELGYCRETIQRHLKELVAANLLEKRPAKRWPTDRASTYRLNQDEIRKAVVNFSTEENSTLENEKSNGGILNSQQSNPENTPLYTDSFISPDLILPTTTPSEEEKERLVKEIQEAITNSILEQEHSEQNLPTSGKSLAEDKPSADVEFCFQRLHRLDVPLTETVRLLVQKTPLEQLERNISALEEEAVAKGLRVPAAAFQCFVKSNARPRDERTAWWCQAAIALGKRQRDRLIQAVLEYEGEVWVMFTNGQRILLGIAQRMTWEAIAALGEMAQYQ